MFSEAEGNEVLLGLRKGSAKLSPQKGPIYNINQRKGTTHTIEVEQTLIKPPNKDVKKVNLIVGWRENKFKGFSLLCRHLGD